MTPSHKRKVWAHIQIYSPHQESFIHALNKSFGVIELVAFKQKTPAPDGAGASFKTVFGETAIKEDYHVDYK